MKVYLVVEMIERGFATEEKPIAVFESKADAEFFIGRGYAYIKELDYHPKKV